MLVSVKPLTVCPYLGGFCVRGDGGQRRITSCTNSLKLGSHLPLRSVSESLHFWCRLVQRSGRLLSPQLTNYKIFQGLDARRDVFSVVQKRFRSHVREGGQGVDLVLQRLHLRLQIRDVMVRSGLHLIKQRRVLCIDIGNPVIHARELVRKLVDIGVEMALVLAFVQPQLPYLVLCNDLW